MPGAGAYRYALVTPRLLAPHGNRQPTAISPPQAIALLVQMRISTLDRWRKIEPRLDPGAARAADDCGWRFYGALWSALLNADIEPLRPLADEAPDPTARAAAVAALAAIEFEDGSVAFALDAVDRALTHNDFNPVDRAWVDAHRARLLVELGDAQEAQGCALKVAPIGRIAPGDPTAAVLAGAAAELIFSLSNWDSGSLASAIKGRDNLGSWWRSQTLVSGLAAQVEESFKSWSNGASITWGADDRAWLSLRSAMVLSGHAADTPSWRNAASLLARRLLMTTDDHAQLVGALDLLRIGGADKVAKAAAKKLLESGPIEPLAEAANAIDLDAATRTSLAAAIRLTAESSDILSAEAADRHARWALKILTDPGDFVERLRPHFIVADEVIGLLRRLCVAVSPEVDNEIRQHLASLPPVTDQLEADRYGKLVGRLIDEDWTTEQVKALATARSGHLAELSAAFDRVIAARDPEHRAGLLARLAAGDFDALHSFGNVTELPGEVVARMISVLEEQVLARVEDARSGTIRVSGRDPLGTLVLLSAWHPDEARWNACIAALSEPLLIGEYTVPAIGLIGRLAREIPAEVADQLTAPLQLQATRTTHDHELRVFNPTADPRGPARLTLAQLFPEIVADADLLDLLRGDAGQRAAAVGVVTSADRFDRVAVLAAMSKDEDADVRAAVAKGLAVWVSKEPERTDVSELLDQVLSEPGTKLGLAVSETLTDDAPVANLGPLLRRLAAHPSAVVRWRAKHALSRVTD